VKAPIRFLSTGVVSPGLAHVAASTNRQQRGGHLNHGDTPQQVAAAKPAMSPTTPPPRATIHQNHASSRRWKAAVVDQRGPPWRAFSGSPLPGTASKLVSNPAPFRPPPAAARRNRALHRGGLLHHQHLACPALETPLLHFASELAGGCRPDHHRH